VPEQLIWANIAHVAGPSRRPVSAVRERKSYEEEHPPVEDDLAAVLLRFGAQFVWWSVENLDYAQLLFWRLVPGFRPTDSAYEPAVELYDHNLARLAQRQQRGLIWSDVDIAAVQRDWTVLSAGVVSQRLANESDEGFERGRFTTALPGLAQMFATRYGNRTRTRASKQTTSSRRGHAGKR